MLRTTKPPLLRGAYLVLRAMRRIYQRQRGVLTEEPVQHEQGHGGAGELLQEQAAGQSRCSLPGQPELLPSPVSGALCAAASRLSPPGSPEHRRPSLPSQHKWLQWDFCKVLPGMIYDTPSANF